MRTLYQITLSGGYTLFTPADDYDHAVLRAAEEAAARGTEWDFVRATSIRA